MQSALTMAAAARARGSAVAAYQTLRATTQHLIPQARDAHCGITAPLLTKALARAEASPTAAEAAAHLDLGFAGVVSLAVQGRYGGDDLSAKRPAMPESSHYALRCPDVFVVTADLGAALAGSDADLARAIVRISRRTSCPAIVASLKDLDPALHRPIATAIVLDEPSGQSVAPESQLMATSCPELPVVMDRLGAAIAEGAPLYNRGDHESCRARYRDAALAVRRLVAPLHCPAVERELRRGLEEAASAPSPGDAAWALRHAFDRIGAGRQGDDPPSDGKGIQTRHGPTPEARLTRGPRPRRSRSGTRIGEAPGSDLHPTPTPNRRVGA